MIRVRDLMSKKVFTLFETDDLGSARSLMSLQRIRHIPIISEDNHFTGLLTHRDILSATISRLAEVDAETQEEIDAGIPIREIMRQNVSTIGPDVDIKDAAGILLTNKYGCLPVIEDGLLVGIITEADFLKLAISLMNALEEQQ
ncbi:MAG: CBS domain-containing protein [Desulfovibrionaceae bacterium]|nr:CBS domain-containing protein [Desulfovibrionaceae bacterium]MDD4951425.1 CBS domain-containing protein [Desulfovibrionaceae bacterium]